MPGNGQNVGMILRFQKCIDPDAPLSTMESARVTETLVQTLFADRIGGLSYGKSTAIYKFEKIKRAKAAAVKANPDQRLIDMGVGEPDEPAFPAVIDVLREEAGKSENRGYTDNGIAGFRDAAFDYMQRVFGVEKTDAIDVLHSIGSKSALTLLPACFINPGDVTLTTVPGYQVFATHAKYYGGVVHSLPLLPENQFLPDLDAIPTEVCRSAKVLVLNYPNNPTGAGATTAFFEKAVEFAKKNNVLIIHDAAYAGLMFDGNAPLSILSIPGAADVALELHSLSKGYNMTGWRLGFVMGNALAVRAYGDVKDNSDSGQFAAIQKAGIYCLRHPEIASSIAAKYSRRMDLLVPMLNRHGFQAQKPVGSFFLYVKAPKKVTSSAGTTRTFANAEEVSQALITEKMISTVPWDDAGPYLRWSVTFIADGIDDEVQVVNEIDRRLSDWKFEF